MSAYKWSRDHEESRYVVETRDNDHSICFSTHCSRSELIYFVNYFTPNRVIGFKNPYYGNDDVEHEDNKHIEISQPSPKKMKVDVKLNRKVDKELLQKCFDW